MSLIKSNHGGLGGSGAPGGALGSFYSHTINQSLRFDGSTSFLYFTPTSNAATDSSKMTFSTWVKTWGFGISDGYILSAGSSYIDGIGYNPSHIFTSIRNGGVGGGSASGAGVRRDPSAWYHLYVIYDADAGYNRIYVNGVLDGEASTSSDLGKLGVQNNLQRLVRKSNGSTYLDLYLAETHFVDGSIVPIGTFAETKDGVWIPVKTSGITYGNNGWYLDYADSSDIGKDVSGRGNHWTSSGLSASDVVPDSPTGNNFGVMNPLDKNSMTLSEGNLKVVPSGDYKAIRGTFGIPTSGKWYFEARYLTPGGGNVQDNQVGIVTASNVLSGSSPYPQAFTYGVGYLGLGQINRGGSAAQSSLTAVTAGKVLGVAVNVDDDEVQFYLDGSAVGTTHALVSTTEPNFPFYVGATNRGVIFNFGQDSTFTGAVSAGGNADANGIGDFAYAPPSDHLALCTSNLPDPTIGPGESSQADDHFDTLLWTGNGSSAGDQQEIDGLSFTPDFVWTKGRGGDGSNPASGQQYHELHDSVRGAGKRVFTNTADAESDVQTIKSFDSDGFTVAMGTGGQSGTNQITTTMVGWCWKAGTAFSNDSSATGVGTLDSTGSVNQAAGFSIISYTGTIQSGETVAHGLGGVPEMIWAKNRDSSANWVVFTKDLSSEHTLYFNNTIGQNSSATTWGNHTSTVFGVDDDPQSNPNGDATIAYLFRSIEGYSKVGKYTGNGNADGTFVYTGFRPAWVMIKNITNSGTNFLLFDNKRSTFNVTNDALLAGSNAAEYVDNSSFAIDMLSNGFKPRSSYGDSNQSGSTMIYLAMAEAPFKFANAR